MAAIANSIRVTNGSGHPAKSYKRNGTGLIFDKSLYRTLNNRPAMETYAVPTTPRNEFDFFMQQAALKSDSALVDDDLDALDDYFGSLGVTKEYPFKK